MPPQMIDVGVRLNVKGPYNLDPVVQQIKRQVSSVAKNNFGVGTTRNIGAVDAGLRGIADSLSNVSKQARQANAAMDGINGSFDSKGIKKMTRDATTAIRNISALQSKVKGTNSELKQFGAQAGLAFRRFGAFALLVHSFDAISGAIGHAFKEALQFQKAMVQLGQLGVNSAKDIKSVSDNITKLSTSLGASSAELADVTKYLKGAGLSINEVNQALEVLAKTSLSPTFKNITSSAEGLLSFGAQFKIAAKDYTSAFDSINAVSQQFAAESEDIIEGVKRAGAAFAAASGQFTAPKQQLEELIALFTSVRSTTRESADSIGTAFRTIFARLQSNAVVEDLKQMGINLRFTNKEALAFGQGVEGQFVGAFTAVQRLNAALKDIPSTDPRFSAIVEKVGGQRQLSKVLPLIQQFPMAQKALTVAQTSNNSVARDAAKAQDQFLVKLAKVKEEFLDLFRVISQSNTFGKIIDGFAVAASSATTFVKALEPVIPLIAAVGTIKLGAAFSTITKAAIPYVTGKRFSGGGSVPGQGNGDTVPAYLTPKEFVMTTKATSSLGVSKLAAANKHPHNYKLVSSYGNDRDEKQGILHAALAAAIKSRGGMSAMYADRYAKGGLVKGFGNAVKMLGSSAKETTAYKAYTNSEFGYGAPLSGIVGMGLSEMAFKGVASKLRKKNRFAKGGVVGSISPKVIRDAFGALGIDFDPTKLVKGVDIMTPQGIADNVGGPANAFYRYDKGRIGIGNNTPGDVTGLLGHEFAHAMSAKIGTQLGVGDAGTKAKGTVMSSLGKLGREKFFKGPTEDYYKNNLGITNEDDLNEEGFAHLFEQYVVSKQREVAGQKPLKSHSNPDVQAAFGKIKNQVLPAINHLGNPNGGAGRRVAASAKPFRDDIYNSSKTGLDKLLADDAPMKKKRKVDAGTAFLKEHGVNISGKETGGNRSSVSTTNFGAIETEYGMDFDSRTNLTDLAEDREQIAINEAVEKRKNAVIAQREIDERRKDRMRKAATTATATASSVGDASIKNFAANTKNRAEVPTTPVVNTEDTSYTDMLGNSFNYEHADLRTQKGLQALAKHAGNAGDILGTKNSLLTSIQSGQYTVPKLPTGMAPDAMHAIKTLAAEAGHEMVGKSFTRLDTEDPRGSYIGSFQKKMTSDELFEAAKAATGMKKYGSVNDIRATMNARKAGGSKFIMDPSINPTKERLMRQVAAEQGASIQKMSEKQHIRSGHPDFDPEDTSFGAQVFAEKTAKTKKSQKAKAAQSAASAVKADLPAVYGSNHPLGDKHAFIQNYVKQSGAGSADDRTNAAKRAKDIYEGAASAEGGTFAMSGSGSGGGKRRGRPPGGGGSGGGDSPRIVSVLEKILAEVKSINGKMGSGSGGSGGDSSSRTSSSSRSRGTSTPRRRRPRKSMPTGQLALESNIRSQRGLPKPKRSFRDRQPLDSLGVIEMGGTVSDAIPLVGGLPSFPTMEGFDEIGLANRGYGPYDLMGEHQFPSAYGLHDPALSAQNPYNSNLEDFRDENAHPIRGPISRQSLEKERRRRRSHQYTSIKPPFGKVGDYVDDRISDRPYSTSAMNARERRDVANMQPWERAEFIDNIVSSRDFGNAPIDVVGDYYDYGDNTEFYHKGNDGYDFYAGAETLLSRGNGTYDVAGSKTPAKKKGGRPRSNSWLSRSGRMAKNFVSPVTDSLDYVYGPLINPLLNPLKNGIGKAAGMAGRAGKALPNSLGSGMSWLFNGQTPEMPSMKGMKGSFGAGLSALKGRVAGFGMPALAIGSAFAPQAIEHFTGSIENQKYGKEYARKGAAIGGAIQYGGIGASVGSAFGPQGAIVGGMAGAAIGFVSALKEADDKLRDLDFQKKFDKMADALEGVVSGKVKLNRDSIGDVKRGLSTANLKSAIEASNTGGATGAVFNSLENWSNGLRVKLGGVDSAPDRLTAATKARQQTRSQSLRDQLSPQAPMLKEFGNQIADSLKLTKNDLRFGNQSGRIQKFKEAGGSDIAEGLANATGVSVKKIYAEFDKTILSLNEERTAREANSKALQAQTVQIQQFDRISEAIQSAAVSVGDLQSSADGLQAAFNGTVQAIPVSNISANARFGNLDTKGFNRSVDSVTGALGNGKLSGQFGETARGVNAAANVLPDIISNANVSGDVEDKGLSGRIQDGLRAQGIPEMIRDKLANVLEGLKPEELAKQAGENVQKLTDDLLSTGFANVKQVLEDAAKQLEDRANRFTQDLVTHEEMISKVGDSRFAKANLEVTAGQSRGRALAAVTGNSNDASMSMESLNRPFASRQEFLTGLSGADAMNPDAISTKLSDTRKDIAKTKVARDGATGAKQDALSEHLVTLQANAQRLGQALGHLTETAERNAVIQEKINKLEEDRQGRLSFTEKLLTADPSQRREMAKNANMSDVAVRQGNFAGFGAKQIQGVLEHLSSLGNAQTTYGASASDIREKLLTNSGMAIGTISPGSERQRASLYGQQADNDATAVKAQEAIIKDQSNLQQTFFTELKSIQKEFFSTLQMRLAEAEKRDISTQKGIAAGKAKDLGNASGALGQLKAGGFSLEEGRRLNQNADISKLGETLSNKAQLPNSIRSLKDEFSKNGIGDVGAKGLTPKQEESVTSKASEFLNISPEEARTQITGPLNDKIRGLGGKASNPGEVNKAIGGQLDLYGQNQNQVLGTTQGRLSRSIAKQTLGDDSAASQARVRTFATNQEHYGKAVTSLAPYNDESSLNTQKAESEKRLADLGKQESRVAMPTVAPQVIAKVAAQVAAPVAKAVQGGIDPRSIAAQSAQAQMAVPMAQPGMNSPALPQNAAMGMSQNQAMAGVKKKRRTYIPTGNAMSRANMDPKMLAVIKEREKDDATRQSKTRADMKDKILGVDRDADFRQKNNAPIIAEQTKADTERRATFAKKFKEVTGKDLPTGKKTGEFTPSQTQQSAAKTADIGKVGDSIGQNAQSMGGAVDGLNKAMAQVNATLGQVGKIFSEMPKGISLERNGRIEVVINGTEAMKAIQGDLAEAVTQDVMKAMIEKLPKIISSLPA